MRDDVRKTLYAHCLHSGMISRLLFSCVSTIVNLLFAACNVRIISANVGQSGPREVTPTPVSICSCVILLVLVTGAVSCDHTNLQQNLCHMIRASRNQIADVYMHG
jgi:hypothetical protein